jgi:hypothetical protein
MVWFWFSYVVYRIPLWIMLCGILLIQLKLGSLAYNFNFRKYVLINYESFCYSLIILFTLFLPLHIIYLLHLLSTNHKCTQPCYFPLLYKPTAQKVKMVMKNSSMRSSRLYATAVAIPAVL